MHKKFIVLIFVFFIFVFGCRQKDVLEDQLLLSQAENFINIQEYDKARGSLLQAVKLNPRNLKAYVLLGDVYYFQSDLIMFRMQIINLILKYGKRIHWATSRELDLATPTEELMRAGMDSYQKALDLIKSGVKEETVEPSYLNYELGWGYLAQDDLVQARKNFQESVINGRDHWDAKRALVYLNFLERKQKQVKLDEDKQNNNKYLGKVIGKAYTKGKLVTLTFDDGPSKIYTPQVLSVLKKYNVKATFFVCGEQVKYFPQVVKQIYEQGHEIANHSYSHPNLFKNKNMRGLEMVAQIKKTNELIEKITKIKPVFFRAPYNYAGKETVKAVNDTGLMYVGWTFSGRDWQKPSAQTMVNIFNKDLIPGSIVLLHDGGGNRTNTVAALPAMIEAAQKKGYRFVTLGELLK